MLNHTLLASFRAEIEKTGAVPLPVALGAAGALGGGAYSLSKMVDDFKKDQFLYDMGQMPKDVYDKRMKRRMYLVGASSALGGVAGASSPLLASKAKELLGNRLRAGLSSARSQTTEAARDAGRAFTEEAVRVATEQGPEVAQRLGAEAAGGAYKRFQEKGGVERLLKNVGLGSLLRRGQ